MFDKLTRSILPLKNDLCASSGSVGGFHNEVREDFFCDPSDEYRRGRTLTSQRGIDLLWKLIDLPAMEHPLSLN